MTGGAHSSRGFLETGKGGWQIVSRENEQHHREYHNT